MFHLFDQCVHLLGFVLAEYEEFAHCEFIVWLLPVSVILIFGSVYAGIVLDFALHGLALHAFSLYCLALCCFGLDLFGDSWGFLCILLYDGFVYHGLFFLA